MHFKMQGCGFIIINSQLAEHRSTAGVLEMKREPADSHSPWGGQSLFTMQEQL